MELREKIFTIASDNEFEQVALEIFHFQRSNCVVYRDFCNALTITDPKSLNQIPFLPISFFKTHEVISTKLTSEKQFLSSGTGGDRSKHLVSDLSLYERSFVRSFEEQINKLEDSVILALLPNYLEQGDSSLVYMVDQLIEHSKNPNSAFILDDPKRIGELANNQQEAQKKIVLFGVSYALLDLCELQPDLSNCIVIETGGMKGRRKEMTKEALHKRLSDGLNCRQIYSEYGMTELLSQAYATGTLKFRTPPWMKVLIRDVNDPFTIQEDGVTGGINVIDLANLHSCSFIATQDLGKSFGNEFELLGRYDHADIRGCNLLVQ